MVRHYFQTSKRVYLEVSTSEGVTNGGFARLMASGCQHKPHRTGLQVPWYLPWRVRQPTDMHGCLA